MQSNQRVAIVTGAGSKRGIGREIAWVLAEGGAAIAVADRDLDGAQAVAQALVAAGHSAIAVGVDVTDEDSVNAMMAVVHATWGRLDILCNNAGITQPIDTLSMSKQDFMRVINVNLLGTFLCSKAAVSRMAERGYGRIVNTSSVSAKCGGGVFGGSHYCAAKAGVLGFSKALAKEVASLGITVNSVCPGAIATDIRVGISQEKESAIAESCPMKRVGTAREVAQAIAFLASDAASYITGEEIDINGGSFMD